MFDYNEELAIKELFLFQYVLVDAVAARDIFGMLCDIYCVGDCERNELADLLDDAELNDIRTIADYYRKMRYKQYCDSFCGGYFVDDERVEELVAIKGAVFESAKKIGLTSAYEKSCGVAYDELVRLAAAGAVCAKRLLGILQTEGIYITKDVDSGLGNLRDAADWTDVPALATFIYYSANNRQEYFNKLYTATQKTDYAVIVEQLQMRYGIERCETSEAAKLLEKVFAADGAKREICSAQCLRVIRSNVLSEKDKRTVLLSSNKELVPAVCGLPLRLECKKIAMSADVQAVLNRAEEMAEIVRALSNNDLRNCAVYRCPCICSDSEYIREAYAEAVGAAFADSNVVQIDVGELLPMDFDATENNVFVRSCLEKENNVFIVKLSGKLDERLVGVIKTFAASNARKSFAIARLGVSIDLSSVFPIFICDKRNAELLDGNVGVVGTADIAESEKALILDDLLSRKQAALSMGAIVLDDAAKEILLGMSISEMGDALDQALLSQRGSATPVRLSAEIIGRYKVNKKALSAYGFGGSHAKK